MTRFTSAAHESAYARTCVAWPVYAGKDIRATAEEPRPVSQGSSAADRGQAAGHGNCGCLRAGDDRPGTMAQARDGNQLDGYGDRYQASRQPWWASPPTAQTCLARVVNSLHRTRRIPLASFYSPARA